jgi:outer membrane lipoprotein LolB
VSLRLAWGVAVAALLSACASVPDSAPVLSGRLAVSVAASAAGPARGFNAAFDLQGDAQRGRLDLSTPLGPRLGTARWTPAEAVLDDGQSTRRYPDLTTLAKDLLGEPLPLQALPDWLRGRPWPGAAHRAGEGGFEQLGWTLDTSQLADGRLNATRAAPPAVTLRVRLTPGGPS